MTNGNECAYPMANPLNEHELGLTKREYFSAMAMQGVLSAQAGTSDMVRLQAEYYAKQYPNNTMIEAITMESVLLADALIKALNQQ